MVRLRAASGKDLERFRVRRVLWERQMLRRQAEVHSQPAVVIPAKCYFVSRLSAKPLAMVFTMVPLASSSLSAQT
jgi:hypothetical protein